MVVAVSVNNAQQFKLVLKAGTEAQPEALALLKLVVVLMQIFLAAFVGEFGVGIIACPRTKYVPAAKDRLAITPTAESAVALLLPVTLVEVMAVSGVPFSLMASQSK